MRTSGRRGIALVSVIFVSILVAVYVTSALVINRGRFRSEQQDHKAKVAEDAARSGLEYALARLEEDPAWRGEMNSVTVDTPSLKVVEDSGNVVGLIRSAEGSYSQFRIRFNHQDGPGGGDGMDDPDQSMFFDTNNISVNNLLQQGDAAFPGGEGLVPGQTVALVCEGRVAEEFANSTTTSPNPSIQSMRATRVIERFYRVTDVQGESIADAVTMAGREFEVELFSGSSQNPKRLALGDVRGLAAPRIRSRGDITVRDISGTTVTDGEVVGDNGELLVPTGNSINADLATGVAGGEEDINSHFYQLAWDQVDTPDGSGGKMDAGVYVVREDGSLSYYSMNFEEYKSHITANPTDLGQPMTLDGSQGVLFVAQGDDYQGQPSDKNRFVIGEDVLVEAVGGVTDLTIEPAAGAEEDLDPQGGGGSHDDYVTDVTWPDYTSQWPASNAAGQAKNNAMVSFVATMAEQNTNNGSRLHRFFKEISQEGSITDGNGNTVTWDQAELDVNGAAGPAMSGYLANSTAISNFTNPNPNAIPVPPPVIPGQPAPNQTPSPDALTEKLFAYFKGEGSPSQFTKNPDIADATTVNDVEVEFAPGDEAGARLAATGDVRIAADVTGHGASIKARGDIRLVGLGFDIDASAGGEEGPNISLYATGDIVLSTLKPNTSGTHEYTGMNLKGLVYAWEDVELKTGHQNDPNSNPQQVYLQGSLIAYGGEPGVDDPGSKGGRVHLSGDQIDLVFDPAYLLGLTGNQGLSVGLEPLSQRYR